MERLGRLQFKAKRRMERLRRLHPMTQFRMSWLAQAARNDSHAWVDSALFCDQSRHLFYTHYFLLSCLGTLRMEATNLSAHFLSWLPNPHKVLSRLAPLIWSGAKPATRDISWYFLRYLQYTRLLCPSESWRKSGKNVASNLEIVNYFDYIE